MAINARWKVGNTRPAVVITLDLGTDPETGTARTLAGTDVVSQIMRPPSGPAILSTLEVLDAPTNQVKYKPEAGDLDIAGTYEVEFDITDVATDVETVPDDSDDNYSYKISAKLA